MGHWWARTGKWCTVHRAVVGMKGSGRHWVAATQGQRWTQDSGWHGAVVKQNKRSHGSVGGTETWRTEDSGRHGEVVTQHRGGHGTAVDTGQWMAKWLQKGLNLFLSRLHVIL